MSGPILIFLTGCIEWPGGMDMLIPTGTPDAVACIQGYASLRGTVKFYAVREGTLVVAQVRGLPENAGGFYGFHIHQGNSCRGIGFPDTGSHYNPENTPHPVHAGDLPPLLRCGEHAFLAVCTDRFRIADIIGKTVVIHSGSDDFRSKPAGDSGEKIGCGIIRQL